MSVDMNATGGRTPEDESSMFAPTPVWARETKKRRGRSGRSTPAGATADDPVLDAGEAGAGAGVIGATTAAEPVDTIYETQAVRTVERRGVPAGAIAAGLVAVAAIGGVAWYAMQPRDNGMAQLTPGATTTTTTSQTALNTATPPSAAQLPVSADATSSPPTPADTATTPAETATTTTHRTASTTTHHAAAPVVTRRTTLAARTPAPRARPTNDYNAMDTGVNASTTAPMVSTPAPSAPAPSVNTAPTATNPATVNPAPMTSQPMTSQPDTGATSAAPSSSTTTAAPSTTTP
ncbi:MAG: hypothetical protein JWQ97_4032 [Phenylobacterium sp.]|nr:hypothetical protein [Phenylobacterium sp.]